MIAGDICVDRSPPNGVRLGGRRGERVQRRPEDGPSRCSPTSRLGSDRDRSASRWSVEPPDAVEGAVSGVDGRWKAPPSSMAVSVALGWAAVALVLSGARAHTVGHVILQPSEWHRRYLESIVRVDVALKQADDRTVEVRATEASGCRSRTRGARHESSRTSRIIGHPSTTFVAWRSRRRVCNPRRTRTPWRRGISDGLRDVRLFRRRPVRSIVEVASLLRGADRDGLCCVATSCPAAASRDVVSHRTPTRDGVVRRWGADRLRRAVDRCERPGASPRPVPARVLHRRRHVPGLVRCTHGSGLAGMASDANVVERRSRRGGCPRHGAQRHERGVDGPSVGNLLLVRDPLARPALRHRRRPRAVRVPGDGRLPPAPRR